jgi:AraC-like DNA-binding protein
MPEATVPASIVSAFLEFAVTRRLDRRVLLDQAHLRADILVDPDARIPLAQYVALVKAGIALSGDPALALHFGECVPVQDISIVAYLASTTATAEESRREMNRYGPLMIDDGEGTAEERYQFVRENGSVAMVFSSRVYVDHPLLLESALARGVTGARKLVASMNLPTPIAFPKAIRFTHAEPAHRAAYDRIFGVPLTFSAGMNAIIVDAAFLSLVMPQQSYRLAVPVLREHADKLLARLESSRSARAWVERELQDTMRNGDVRMTTVARKLGLSRATLFRRLKAEGVTYEQVLDAVRHRLAVRYLSEDGLTVGRTSALLGFSEQAAFSRAFKRWTGVNPRSLTDRQAEIR